MRRAGPLTVLAALLAGPLPAQTISLAPSVVELKGALGQSSTQTLTLSNGMPVPVTFDLVAQDVVVRNGVRVYLEAGAQADSMAATAVFVPRSITIPAGGSGSVDVTITARPPATHRAVVALFRGRTRFANGAMGTMLSLGSLLTFTLSNEIQVTATDLRATPPGAATLLAFDTLLANTGAEPAIVRGVAAVLDAAGLLVGRVEFEARRLLPGERAALHGEYPGTLAAGRYRAVATFDYEGQAITRSAEFAVR